MAPIVSMVILQLLIGSRELFAFEKISPEKLKWKDAKTFCANQNSMLTDPDVITNIEEYWTGAYYASSQWIHIIGCFEDSSVKAVTNRSSIMKNNPNIGLCQLKCYPLEAFAVKSNRCLCLNGLPPKEGSSSSNNCPIQCNDTHTDVYLQDCGGVSHYNVYRTTRTAEKCIYKCQVIRCVQNKDETIQPVFCLRGFKKTCTEPTASYSGTLETTGWKNSLRLCKEKGAYLLGNISINNASAACKIINNPRPEFTWIGILRQPVLVGGEEFR
ncbi:uncharacterized protein LOC134243310 isoform X2 [Saccostrea cucullata]|uniref:uncharacterized protein LOC134243310 isoform X2 n=1 Tax=Saccostrea cuccullata TaxID=36930 RepID=UPI002ED5A6CC